MNPSDQLGLFVHRVEELRTTRAVKDGLRSEMSINYHRAQGMRFRLTEPDSEDLRSFLLTFRQFVSEEEPVFLGRIYNLGHKHISHQDVQADLIESRKHWKVLFKRGGIELIWNNRPLEPAKIFDLWINGHYFHNDEKKRAFLSNIADHERLLVRNVFLNFLGDATQEILYVGHAVKFALREGYTRQ